MPHKTPPPALPVRKMRWPRSRGKWAAEDCLPPSTARNSGPRAATTWAAASFALVIRRAASAATRTATDTTGTRGRIQAAYIVREWECGGLHGLRVARVLLPDRTVLFRNGKAYEPQPDDTYLALRLSLICRAARCWPGARQLSAEGQSWQRLPFAKGEDGRLHAPQQCGDRSCPG